MLFDNTEITWTIKSDAEFGRVHFLCKRINKTAHVKICIVASEFALNVNVNVNISVKKMLHSEVFERFWWGINE